MRKVLFVCTGNQCRSAAADVMLRRLAQDAGVEVVVSSAGTLDCMGVGAHPDTVHAAAARGYDLRAHESRQVRGEMLAQADVVLAMARNHVAWLKMRYPEVADRVRLFKPYCLGLPESGAAADDIADPVTRPLEVHLQCVEEIEKLLTQLVKRWQADA